MHIVLTGYLSISQSDKDCPVW